MTRIDIAEQYAVLYAKHEEVLEILHDLVRLDTEQSMTGGGPNFKARQEKAWTRAYELFE